MRIQNLLHNEESPPRTVIKVLQQQNSIRSSQRKSRSSSINIPQSPYTKFCKTLSPIIKREISPMKNQYVSANILQSHQNRHFNIQDDPLKQKLNFYDFIPKILQKKQSPLKKFENYQQTENFIVDEKLQNIEHSYVDLMCNESIAKFKYHTAQNPPHKVLLLQGNKLLLSPGNPTRQIMFDKPLIQTEPQKRQKSKSKKLTLDQMNSFHYNSEAKVQQYKDRLDEFVQNEDQYSSSFCNSRREIKKTKKKVKKQTCNCKNSKCLKLYCDCFRAGIGCAKSCNCLNCQNNDDHQEQRNKAISQALDQNPECFNERIETTNGHVKGCHCKKSGCIKKYCECFQAGVKCTDICKCVQCKNGGDNCHQHQKENEQNYYLQVPQQIPQEQYYQQQQVYKHHQQQHHQREYPNQKLENPNQAINIIQNHTFGFQNQDQRVPFQQRHIQTQNPNREDLQDEDQKQNATVIKLQPAQLYPKQLAQQLQYQQIQQIYPKQGQYLDQIVVKKQLTPGFVKEKQNFDFDQIRTINQELQK